MGLLALVQYTLVVNYALVHHIKEKYVLGILEKKEMLFRQIYINALMGKNFSSKASCDAFLLYQQKCKKYFLY